MSYIEDHDLDEHEESCLNKKRINKPAHMRKDFKDIKVGKDYQMVSHRVDNAKNKVTCISEDYLDLERGIKYFCFTDRISKVPTQKEFIDSLKDGAASLPKDYTKRQYDKACRMLEIRRNTFAMWDFELEGDSPSVSLFRTYK